MEFILVANDGTKQRLSGEFYSAFGRIPSVTFELDGVLYAGLFRLEFEQDEETLLPVLRSYSPVIVEMRA